MKKIIAFESSCDDTCVAIVAEDGRIISEVSASSAQAYEIFGGVVPEIGSRAHIEQIHALTKIAFLEANLTPQDIDAVAATFAPGLLGPLLVGAQFAKGLAVSLSRPLIAVHHLEGHILSGLGEADFLPLPFVALVVSGGHTALYRCDEDYRMSKLGETLDDAAGEAFDKIGRTLGFAYPAGKIIDELAQQGHHKRFYFPKMMPEKVDVNFSFSGLKTHAMSIIKKYAPFDQQMLADFCAGLAHSIASSLCDRTIRALKQQHLSSLVIGGGVAANSQLRAMLSARCREENFRLYLPRTSLCTDNAAIIGRAALMHIARRQQSSLALDVKARLPIEEKESLTCPILQP